MSLIITPTDPALGDGLSLYPAPPPSEEPAPLTLYMVGSLDQIQVSVHYLHTNGYADYRRWTPAQPIPQTGLIIPPKPGRLFTCLEQRKRLTPNS